MVAEHIDIFPLSREDSRLRPAEELIARAGHHIHTRTDRCLYGRLTVDAEPLQIDQGSAAEILKYWQTTRMRQRSKLLAACASGKADDAVIAGMDLHERACLLADGSGIVCCARLIRRTDLPQHRAAGGHNVRHAEASADLDQLSA